MSVTLFTTSASVRTTPSGAPLAFAALGFLMSGTTAAAPVYDSSDLDTELPNPVIADADGVWPAIWLDPAVTYRVRLTDRYGALQYDVDPYLPYAGGAFEYQDAQVRASTDGSLVPGASLTFTAGGDPAELWADVAMSAALPNPVKADSGGLFPPVYVAGPVDYAGWISGSFPPPPPKLFEITAAMGSGGVRGYNTAAWSGVIGNIGTLVSNTTGMTIGTFYWASTGSGQPGTFTLWLRKATEFSADKAASFTSLNIDGLGIGPREWNSADATGFAKTALSGGLYGAWWQFEGFGDNATERPDAGSNYTMEFTGLVT